MFFRILLSLRFGLNYSAFTYEKHFFQPDYFCRWGSKEQQPLWTLHNAVFKMQN